MPDNSRSQPLSARDRSAPGTIGHCLCLNASEGMLQLIIARQEPSGTAPFTLLCAQTWHAPSQGAELLAPALNNALTRLGLRAGDIRRIACVRGPGAFTGLRLTLATAAGLARATGAEQAGIDFLPLLAHSACRRLGGLSDPHDGAHAHTSATRAAQQEHLVWVLTHARKNLIHMQGFSVRLSRRKDCSEAFSAPLPLTGIHVCPPGEAGLLIRARQEAGVDGLVRPLLLGSGLSRNHGAVFAALTENAGAAEKRAESGCGRVPAPVLLPADFDLPLPETLLDVAAGLSYASRDIEPLYVRHADAEENLERIALSLGLDPDKARARLIALRYRPALGVKGFES